MSQLSDTAPTQAEPTRMTLPTQSIRRDGGTQAREGSPNEQVIADYAEVLINGGYLPPVTVFDDGTHKWLADGFHTMLAHSEAERYEVECFVYEGTQRDAILYAAGANSKHGLRRTINDKRNAVRMVLADTEWAAKSNQWVAEVCNVSKDTVTRMRLVVKADAGDETCSEALKAYDAKRHPKREQEEADDESDSFTDQVAAAPLSSAEPDEDRDEFGPGPSDDELGEDPYIEHGGEAKGCGEPKTKAKTANPRVAAEPDVDQADGVASGLPTHDAKKRALPNEFIRHAFGDVAKFEDWNRRLRTIMREVEDACEHTPACYKIDWNVISAHLGRNVIEHLWAAKPYAVCPSCDGKGCKNCRKNGFVTKLVFESLEKQEAGAA